MVIGYIVSFICGVLALGFAEFLLLWCFFTKTRRTNQDQLSSLPSFSIEADPNAPSKISIEGELWVASVSPLQVDCANKTSSLKLPKDRKQKREIEQKAEISVALKYAKLQDKYLILAGSDGTTTSILLEGCAVMAVSSTSSATRKWAKKYPVKLEHSSRTLMGTTVCLLYFKTGWEKETWCEALRAAARTDYSPVDWYSKLKHEFEDYMSQLKQNFPEVFKMGPSGGRSLKGSTQSTKRSISWKRLLKKKKGDGARTKAVTVQTEDLRPDDSLHTSSSFHDFETVKGDQSDSNNQSDTNPESKKNLEGSDYGSIDFEVHPRKQLDGGVAAMNIMLSRLFFDLHHSSDFISVVHLRIQTLLSRIPTPAYISPITCSRIDIGKSCPFVHSLRALPIADDVFGLEADIEYSGGAVLTLETRLDMRESRVAGDQKNETSTAGAVTADIINKSLETVEDDLEVAGEMPPDQTSGSSKRKRWNQWKQFLSTVADQVSQVPLTLSMKVVSLKGTLQLRIKASPSDRIWYSFASMPALELHPEPSVGDHKITTGPLVAYIAERIQILVNETMVYPSSEDIHIPWMMSDEENWVPASAAPFPQVVAEKPKELSNRCESSEAGGAVNGTVKSSAAAATVTASATAAEGFGGISELERPLLDKKPEAEEQQQQIVGCEESGEANNASSFDYQGSEGETSFRGSSDESKRKKGSRRDKMLSLGKKFEERTRLFAEKVRERFEKE